MWLRALLIAALLGCASGALAADAGAAKGTSMKLTIYLLFEGDCGQAMEFYRSVFGGELTLTTVGASPMKAAFPASMQHLVVNARLVSAMADISASDWLRPGEKAIKGNTVSLYLSGGTPAETKALYDKLAQGGEVTDPLSEQPFGTYGALNDRFGVRWRFHSAEM